MRQGYLPVIGTFDVPITGVDEVPVSPGVGEVILWRWQLRPQCAAGSPKERERQLREHELEMSSIM